METADHLHRRISPLSCLSWPFITLGECVYGLLLRMGACCKRLFSSSPAPSPLKPLDQARISSSPAASSQTIAPARAAASPLPSDRLIGFYHDVPNDAGITLAALLTKDDAYLERIHNWVQWGFPLREKSGPNPTAAVLDDKTIALFQQDPQLQEKLKTIFERVLKFYGLSMTIGLDGGVQVEKGENFAERAPQSWLKNTDHNHQRITRILKCLKMLQTPGAPSWSTAFFVCLKKIQNETQAVSAHNFSYWQAVHPTV